jgi:hypothetical protein
VPSKFTAGSVAELIADINTANTGGGANTIRLVAGTTLKLTTVDDTTDGATGLPVIAANDHLTIIGNGDTIKRSGPHAFRLFDVAAGASLTLDNLTLSGGLARGAGVSAEGGAVYNQGKLTLDGVTATNNSAQGNLSQAAFGGAIYSSGSLTLEGNTKIQLNFAKAGARRTSGAGADAGGGGVYVAGGAAHLTNASLSSNVASGGAGGKNGGHGGNAFGGGLYVAAGKVTLSNVSLRNNTATGGIGGSTSVSHRSRIGATGGNGYGGGLYVARGTVTLTGCTVSGNTAGGTLGGSGLSNFDKTTRNGRETGQAHQGGFGGNGYGGGVYVARGTITVSNSTVSSNVAQGGLGGFGGNGVDDGGGQGGPGGSGFGGGLYVAAGSATLTGDSVTGNSALAGAGGFGGAGSSTGVAGPGGTSDAGGIDIKAAASVCLDAFTQANVLNNTPNDVVGSYTTC